MTWLYWVRFAFLFLLAVAVSSLGLLAWMDDV
jgi:hypothetical protein